MDTWTDYFTLLRWLNTIIFMNRNSILVVNTFCYHHLRELFRNTDLYFVPNYVLVSLKDFGDLIQLNCAYLMDSNFQHTPTINIMYDQKINILRHLNKLLFILG